MKVIENIERGFKTLIPDEGKALTKEDIISYEVVMPMAHEIDWIEIDIPVTTNYEQ